MSWILLTFLVGTVNLALGYHVAVSMGYGPPTFDAGCEALGRKRARHACEVVVNDVVLRSQAVAAEEEEEEEEEKKAASQQSVQVSLQDLVGALQAEIRKHERLLIDLDSQLRSTESPTMALVEVSSEGLQTECGVYQSDLGEISEQLHTQWPNLDQLKPLGSQIDLLLIEHLTRLDATIQKLDRLEFKGDSRELARQLKDEVVDLVSAVHRCRDSLDEIHMALVWHDKQRHKIDETPVNDDLMDMPNRISFELALQAWCSDNYFRDHSCGALLYDLDGFARVNQEFGLAAGQHALRTVADRMRTCLGPGDTIYRYNGQRIAVVLSSVNAAAGTQAARRISEAVQSTPIPYGGSNIPVSITGTVFQLIANNTPRDILSRLEDGLATAKRITPGRIYLSDRAKAPAPVLQGT